MNIIEKIARTFAAALAGAFAPVFIVLLSLAVIGPAIATMLYVPLSARWPSLRRSSLRAAVAGVVLCIVSSLAAWVIALVIANTLIRLDVLSPIMPYVAAAFAGGAAFFHFRHRATFDLPRGVAILSAILVPIVFFGAMSI